MFDKFGFCWQKLLKAVPINVGSLSSEDVFIFSLVSRRRSRVGESKVQLPGMARRGFKGFTQSSKKKQFQSQVTHNQMVSHSKALASDSTCVEVHVRPDSKN